MRVHPVGDQGWTVSEIYADHCNPLDLQAVSDKYEDRWKMGRNGSLIDAQPLSLLLKASKEVDHLSLYDVVNTPGVTADLSHISSVAKIDGYLPDNDGMKKAFTGADIVIIPAGIPRRWH